MSDEIIQMFSIPLYMDKVDWDFSKLRENSNSRISNKQMLEGQQDKPAAYSKALRVLQDYPEIKNNILDKFHDFIMGIGIEDNFCITTSWITEMAKDDGCFKHRHKNCVFSGLLYFDKDYTNAAPLQLFNPLMHFDTYFSPIAENPFRGHFQVYPETGRLIIFPSYIEHVVENNQSEMRRSLAFNFHPIGFYGQGDSSLNTRWLNL